MWIIGSVLCVSMGVWRAVPRHITSNHLNVEIILFISTKIIERMFTTVARVDAIGCGWMEHRTSTTTGFISVNQAPPPFDTLRQGCWVVLRGCGRIHTTTLTTDSFAKDQSKKLQGRSRLDQVCPVYLKIMSAYTYIHVHVNVRVYVYLVLFQLKSIFLPLFRMANLARPPVLLLKWTENFLGS